MSRSEKFGITVWNTVDPLLPMWLLYKATPLGPVINTCSDINYAQLTCGLLPSLLLKQSVVASSFPPPSSNNFFAILSPGLALEGERNDGGRSMM